VLVLSQADVERLLPMGDCVDLMADVLSALARGELHQPLRSVVRPPGQASLMGLMPAHRSGDRAVWALKVICIFADNPKRGLDAHQGGVMLFDGETGQVRALMNASAVTEIRTAAVSGVATRTLARADAKVAAILGSGVQGRSHLQAMRAVRDFDEIRIWSPTAANAATLAEKGGGVAVGSIEEALDGAGVVCTTTTAREPIVRREWLAPGAHVNAVGSSIPTTRELDSATIAASALFVDRRESTENEAGDYLFPLREGAITPDHIRAELGDVLIGAADGRRSPDELTVFKSLGLAVEDLAAAELVYERARAEGAGVEVEF
jgi:ornithine cyclodeaminase/alanine dehydrogenase-like protein (mu-crystallin family)